MITMVLGGLWHGAKWPMVLWGLYHGTLLVVHRLYTTWRSGGGVRPLPTPGPILKLVQVVLFFQLTCLGWLIFRAQSVGQIGDFLVTIPTRLAFTPLAGELLLQLGLLTLPLVAIQVAQYLSNDLLLWLRMRPAWRLASVFAAAAATLAFWILFQSALGAQQEFIYFQF